MQTRTKFVLITIVVGLLAAVPFSPFTPVGQTFWPELPGAEPTGILLPLFIVYSFLSSFALGFGVAFLALGLSWTRKAFPVWTVPSHLAITFMTASFWIHDNLHAVNGENMTGLVMLEYGFHLPMMLGGVVLVIAAARRQPRPSGAQASRSPTPS